MPPASCGTVPSPVAPRERLNRTKHTLGVGDAEIDRALSDGGLSHSDIDFVAITSTQSVGLLTGLIDSFDILLTPHPDDTTLSVISQRVKLTPDQISARQQFSVRPALTGESDNFGTTLFRSVFPEGTTLDWESFNTVGWLDNYAAAPYWIAESGLDGLANRPAQCLDNLRHGFHLPVTVRWRDRELPACFVHHHMAHGAACYYRSGFDSAAVLTHDDFFSGTSYHSGLYLYGDGHRLWPISPNHLTLGMAYNFATDMVGLGLVNGAGKLMGLAPYGDPVFFDTRLVGNETDIPERFGSDLWTTWSAHCRQEGERLGYDMSSLANAARITKPINANIAASTQLLFKETYLAAVRSIGKILAGGGVTTKILCLSGGTALNCPSNSRVWRKGPFENVFIAPTCVDGGLAIGASLHLYHNLLDHPIAASDTPATAYLGDAYGDEVLAAALALDGIASEIPDDQAEAAANDLLADKIIG